MPEKICKAMRSKIRPFYRHLLPVSALLIFQLTFGCSVAKRSVPAASDSPLIGGWHQVSIGVGDELRRCPASMALANGGVISCGNKDTVEFDSDGTFTAKFPDANISAAGTWRADGNVLSVTFTAPREVAGNNRSSTIQVDKMGNSVTTNSIIEGTPTTEIYVRE